MTTGQDQAQPPGDAELITRVRAGDRSAFGELYGRHASAATTLARQFARSAAEVDDLVSEAFARVLDGLLSGKGPDTAFRAYLFTTLRNTAYDRSRKDKRLQFTDDIETHDVAVESDDPVIADLENGLVVKAFAGLPERWQTVLWHTQVEGQSPAEVAILLGMAPNAVSSLAFRAREGLREAYLQAHLAETAAEQCRITVNRLGAWTRGGLSKRERAQVDQHLQECDRCPALAAELAEVNTGLRGLLAPLLLGTAAAGYLSTLGPVVPLAQVGAISGSAGAFGSVGEASGTAGAGGSTTMGSAGSTTMGSAGSTPLAAAGGATRAIRWVISKSAASGAGGLAVGSAAVLIVVVAAALVLTFTGSKSPRQAADSGSGVAATAAGGPNGSGTNAAGSNGAGTNGGGSNGAGTNGAAGSTGSALNGTGSGTAGTPATIGTGTLGPGNTSATTAITTPTLGTAPVLPTGSPATTNTTAIAVAPPAGDTTPSTELTADTTANNPPGSTDSTTDLTDPVTPTDSTSETSGTSSEESSTGQPTTTTGTTTSTSTTTTTSATTSDTVIPPGPVGISGAPVLSAALAAGGAGTLSLTLGGAGNGPTLASSLDIDAPAGIDLALVATTPSGLRREVAVVALDTPVASCATVGTSRTHCTLPALAAGQKATLQFGLAIDPIAVDGDITVSIDGGVPASIPVTLTTGYGSVRIQSDPLGLAAENNLTISATAKTDVADPGPLVIDSWPAGLTPISSSCDLNHGTVTCTAAETKAGATVTVLTSTTAQPELPTVSDGGGRRLTPTDEISFGTGDLGGYGALTLAAPDHPLRAGSTDTLTLSGTPLNGGVINPGPVTLPIQLGSGLTVDITGGLPAGCTSTIESITCTPADGQPLRAALPVTIARTAPDAPPLNPLTIPIGPFHPTTTFAITSGFGSVSATGDLAAGHNGTLDLLATPGDNVTDPGPVTLPAQLSPGVLITGADGCVQTGATYVCAPDSDTHQINATLRVVVLPIATGADSVDLVAGLSGGRSAVLSGSHAIESRRPGDAISVTGPFGATMVGDALLQCNTRNYPYRGSCRGGLTPLNSSAVVTVPTGARVVSAELTWAATAPAAGDASTLDTVSVQVDSDAATAVHGTRPSAIPVDFTGADPVTTGQLFPRALDQQSQTQLAAALTPGPHTISVADLAAKRTGAGISPMAGWSLTVIWTDADLPPSTVDTADPGVASFSSTRGTVTTVASAGAPIQQLAVTAWAADPWARKILSIGGANLGVAITGVHGGLANGFDLLNPAIPAGSATSAVILTNLTSGIGDTQDTLWVGPTLVVREADAVAPADR